MSIFVRQGRALLLAAAVVVGALWLSGCGDDNGIGSGGGGGNYDLSLSCGDRPCKTVTIGSQTWMAENLNYTPSIGKNWCYNNSEDSCNKYGKLYNITAAEAACPKGWKLPDTADWNILGRFAGGLDVAAKKLKATNGWISVATSASANGTDDFGFSALPGGSASAGANFDGAGISAIWWTGTVKHDSKGNAESAPVRNLVTGNSFLGTSIRHNNTAGHSVRCIAD